MFAILISVVLDKHHTVWHFLTQPLCTFLVVFGSPYNGLSGVGSLCSITCHHASAALSDTLLPFVSVKVSSPHFCDSSDSPDTVHTVIMKQQGYRLDLCIQTHTSLHWPWTWDFITYSAGLQIHNTPGSRISLGGFQECLAYTFWLAHLSVWADDFFPWVDQSMTSLSLAS